MFQEIKYYKLKEGSLINCFSENLKILVQFKNLIQSQKSHTPIKEKTNIQKLKDQLLMIDEIKN